METNEQEKLTANELAAAYKGGRRDFRRVIVRPEEGSAGANLAGANLAGANLAGTNLSGANLSGANLADAYLVDANLADAYLVDANLVGANLADANLVGANLSGANLAGTNLADAYLVGANLAGAKNVPVWIARDAPAEPQPPREPWRRRTPEELAQLQLERAQDFRKRYPDVPVVEGLDAKILAAVEANPRSFDMGQWHGSYREGNACGTTHCRAGYAVHLAGDKGYELEREIGAKDAGARIYMASTGRVPHFFASNEAALADLRRCAGKEATPST